MKNRNNYPVDWFDTIRPAILKRDNYKCNHCKISNRQKVVSVNKALIQVSDEFEEAWYLKQGIKTYKVYLIVAHLDHNTFNNELHNLLTLCPTCHFKNDRSNNLLKRLMKKKA